MKIAIATNDKTNVSEVSGRASYYLIYEKGELIKTIKNPFAIGSGGAGYGVVKMMSDENINLIIAGKFGNNMIVALKEKGIELKEVLNKTIDETLKVID